MTEQARGLPAARKTVLIVLFVPSVERDGTTPIDQTVWSNQALETLGHLFGGATAFPKAEGVWRDDERGGILIHDQPVVVHCYVAEEDLAGGADRDCLVELGVFCRRMGREANQGEVGLVIDNEYFAFTDFTSGE